MDRQAERFGASLIAARLTMKGRSVPCSVFSKRWGRGPRGRLGRECGFACRLSREERHGLTCDTPIGCGAADDEGQEFSDFGVQQAVGAWSRRPPWARMLVRVPFVPRRASWFNIRRTNRLRRG